MLVKLKSEQVIAGSRILPDEVGYADYVNSGLDQKKIYALFKKNAQHAEIRTFLDETNILIIDPNAGLSSLFEISYNIS